ncbi:hypothetical protein PHMEG_00015594 [Phytophthora megakarya]|uniref:Uncharacterized protein n=1 Tax=Phytophthora megakarya TaxID=4795 RepID=A0A225W3F6_9STRA|nr:hypothetical protein PHMEG_00015594 [Phytophthora megakarya]
MHTNAERLRAVDTVADGNTAVAVALESKCHRITLYRWSKRRDKIENSMKTSTVILPGLGGPKLPKWVGEMRKEKVRAITSQRLLLISSPHFLKVGQSEPRSNNYGVFVTTSPFGASLIRCAADDFGHAIRHNLEVSGILASVRIGNKLDHIFNMDQTSIYIDMNPKTTIRFRGERDVDVIQGVSENSFRASVFLCASANGAKLPAFIVFAGAEGGPVHCELQKNELHKTSKLY